MCESKYLIEALQNSLEETEEITGCDFSPLTAPGDNYGSLILSADVTIRNNTKKTDRKLACVVKLLPENEFARQMFNVDQTFKQETEFYRTIVPTFQKFQKEQGAPVADYFPKFYGGKIEFDGPKIQDNSLIVIRNLKLDGFGLQDRFLGFDLVGAKLVLEKLADFHGTGIALKLKSPEIFQEQVKKHLTGRKVQDVFPQFLFDKYKMDLISILDEEYVELLKDKFKINAATVREPFATLVHTDAWINNILINKDKTDVKLIDFQTIQYSSAVDDLLLFLFTSVANDVLKEHRDYLIDYYFEKFRKTLESLKCDTKAFTRELFNQEMKTSFEEWQFVHITSLLYPVFQRKMSDLDTNFQPDQLIAAIEITKEQKEKLLVILPMFKEMNWL